MDKMWELRQILCEELDKIADRGELSAGELDTAQKLTDTIKNIDKISMLEDGYSGDGEWEAMGSYGSGRSYRGQKRDTMGRYSRANTTMRGGRYSRTNGYSYAGDIEAQIMEAMDTGNLTASQKSAYKRALDMIREA